jgi:probable phosphoglycerate mutase
MNQTTHIYFIRHGQSQGNLHHRFLGHTDLDLTDLGFRQAEKAAEFLTPVSPDLIVSSDLIRAYHTALPTAKQKGLSIKTYPELREIFAGQWENKEFTRIEEEFPESYQTWIEDTGNAHPDGGERVRDLALRFVHKVEELVQENEGKTICIFSVGKILLPVVVFYLLV